MNVGREKNILSLAALSSMKTGTDSVLADF